MQTVKENRKRDLYLIEEHGNRIFIPQGWCDVAPDPEADEPEIYCYSPTHTLPNSPVETLYVSVRHLDALSETTEAEARESHPALFVYLDGLNAE